jgi:hypothetical protein
MPISTCLSPKIIGTKEFLFHFLATQNITFTNNSSMLLRSFFFILLPLKKYFLPEMDMATDIKK